MSFVTLLMMFGLLPALAPPAAAGPDASATQRLRWTNDALFGQDNQFSNGITWQQFSAPARTLDDTSGTPAFGRFLARPLLPQDPGLTYREGWAIAHHIHTPDEMRRRDLALDDVPFLGMVGWSNSFYAFDDHNFTGFEWLIGWAGDLTQGKHLQRLGHRLSGARRPRGWRHQLDNEPILNIFYTRKHKFIEQPRFDAAVSLDAALGNYFSHGQAGLEMRFGRAPRGFAYVAAPVGKGLQYDATLRHDAATYTYLSVVTAVTRVLHAMPRDGNVLRRNNAWTQENQVRSEKVIRRLIIGLHHERPRWSAHLNLWLGSDSVDPDTVVRRLDTANNFGALTLERRL
ncbi:MAG: lipid A deacylase LpxR family protein [Gammaproteobacteria bacterium]|nr:lipid A deacylase LpxR family protein [Gammaproteobacteria bacterium]